MIDEHRATQNMNDDKVQQITSSIASVLKTAGFSYEEMAIFAGRWTSRAAAQVPHMVEVSFTRDFCNIMIEDALRKI